MNSQEFYDKYGYTMSHARMRGIDVKIGKPLRGQKRGCISDLRGFNKMTDNEHVKIGRAL